MAKEITLTRGYKAIVSDCDYEMLSGFNWRVGFGKSGNPYAARSPLSSEHSMPKTIYMHRQIMSFPKGKQIDHLDHNTLNNQRSNLRVCSASLNSANRRSKKEYKGVESTPYGWKALIMVNYQKIRGPLRRTKEQAAKDYDELALKHFGEFALINAHKERRP